MAEHKHAAVLRAIADGKAVQYSHDGIVWLTPFDGLSLLAYQSLEWRIKPEPKPDVLTFDWVRGPASSVKFFKQEEVIPQSVHGSALVRLVWDGETGKLKSAEVLP